MKASSESGLWAMLISWIAVLVAVISWGYLGKSGSVEKDMACSMRGEHVRALYGDGL